jgi:hypothetical protein
MGKLACFTAVICLSLVLAVSAAIAAPTRAQFIVRADALCAQVQRDLAPLRHRAEAAQSMPEKQQWVAATQLWTDQVRIQTRFTGRVHALGVPPGDTKASSIVAGLDRGLVLARRVQNAFARRSTTSLAIALPEYIRFTLALNRRVAAYGFKVCGR